jgi:hypothetical protein
LIQSNAKAKEGGNSLLVIYLGYFKKHVYCLVHYITAFLSVAVLPRYFKNFEENSSVMLQGI